MTTHETIFALATPQGISGVAVMRLSGTLALQAVEALGVKALKPRVASLRKLVSSSGELIDEALVLYFPAPHSFTGEEIVELQIHGSLAVIDGLTQELSQIKGVRLAEQGEFTKRALMNGRLDLTQVEALADLLAAQSAAQRKQSLHGLSGAFSRQAGRLREEVLNTLMLIEATLDFPDEGDVTEAPLLNAKAKVEVLAITLEQWLMDAKMGQRVRDGVTIALVGVPNAGKSSLLNWFAQEDIAIVSPVAGTTRDVLSVDLSLDGALVRLVDTAGVRETVDEIEVEGVKRAKLAMDKADLVLHLIDLTNPVKVDLPMGVEVFEVYTKRDLEQQLTSSSQKQFFISSATGEGCVELREAIKHFVATFISGESVFVTRERHVRLIKDVLNAFENALKLDWFSASDRVAEELRLALIAIGKITGHVGVEEMLDKLFREFCIGK